MGMSKKNTVIGSGIYYLDIIIVRDYPKWPLLRPFTDRIVSREVGGTCGNVMCLLSHLGWDARPEVSLDDSPEGRLVASDLASWGCDCRHVTNTPQGGTSLLRCMHRKDEKGRPIRRYQVGSPGGSRFPRRHFLRARDEAPAFLKELESAPDVYFFDYPAAGHRLIAKVLRERGTLIMYEPEDLSAPGAMEAVSLSDIVKFSDTRVPDTGFTDGFPDKLFIQTLSDKGLRFRMGGGDWVMLPPVPGGELVDADGAGDWTTATFLDGLCCEGNHSLAGRSREETATLLMRAQEAASRSVSFLGSKGMARAQ